MVLRKAQKEIKWQANKRRKEVEEWKRGDKIMLSTKNLMFKKRLARKLVDWYVSLYIIDKIVFTNAIKLWLLTSIRVYLVVNVILVV